MRNALPVSSRHIADVNLPTGECRRHRAKRHRKYKAGADNALELWHNRFRADGFHLKASLRKHIHHLRVVVAHELFRRLMSEAAQT
jgi:hypothetical protein